MKSLKKPFLGDAISLLKNKVKGLCPIANCIDYELFISRFTINLKPPSNLLKPVASLSTLPVINFRSDLIIDPTLSTGFGYQKYWKEVVWTVKTSSKTNISSIQSFLKSKSTFSLITIPSKFITANITYSFTLFVTNFLMQSSATTVSVQTIDTSSCHPLVRIYSAKDIYYKNEFIHFYAIPVSNISCLNYIKYPNYVFNWKLYKSFNYYDGSLSVSMDPSEYRIKPFSLDVNIVYTIKVFASLNGISSQTFSFNTFYSMYSDKFKLLGNSSLSFNLTFLI
jgi:hypothetical protein